MKARGYPIPGADLGQIATLVHADLSRDGFDVRFGPIQGAPGVAIEVRRPQSMLQRTTGHAPVLKTWLLPNPGGFTVQIGTERAADVAASAVDWLLATPALVTAGYAAFQQAQVDERILRVVDHWAANVAGVNRAPAAVPNVAPCAQCRKPMPYGARFCPHCGDDGKPKPLAACGACQGAMAPDAAFCPHCGKPSLRCVACATALEQGAMFCSGCGARQESP